MYSLLRVLKSVSLFTAQQFPFVQAQSDTICMTIKFEIISATRRSRNYKKKSQNIYCCRSFYILVAAIAIVFVVVCVFFFGCFTPILNSFRLCFLFYFFLFIRSVCIVHKSQIRQNTHRTHVQWHNFWFVYYFVFKFVPFVRFFATKYAFSH